MSEHPVRMPFGMGLSSDALHHVNAFVECSDTTTIIHLMVDHQVDAEIIKTEPALIMVHMQLHGEIVQVPEGEMDE